MILDVVNTIDQQQECGYFEIGSGPVKVLITGSCQSTHFANYLNQLNIHNRYTLRLVNVVNMRKNNPADNRDPVDVTIARLRKDGRLLKVIKESNWYWHEPIMGYGFLNNGPMCNENIYEHGMKAEIDIGIPAWANFCVPFQDWIDTFPGYRERAIQDHQQHGKLSPEFCEEIKAKAEQELEKFHAQCRWSSLWQFEDIFKKTWRKTRYFVTVNHTTKAYTQAIWKLMNENYLKIEIPATFKAWHEFFATHSLFEKPRTPITQYDREYLGIEWDEPTVALKL